MTQRRPRSRLNRSFRWGGLLLGGGFLALIPWSAFQVPTLLINIPSRQLKASAGPGVARLVFIRFDPPVPPAWWAVAYRTARRDTWPNDWTWWRWRAGPPPTGPLLTGIPTGSAWMLECPLWCPAALAFGASLWAHAPWRWRRDPSSCRSCNYDLSGLPPNSPCPECAARPSPPRH